MHGRVIKPFLSDPTVIRASYLNMLELYMLSQFPPGTLFQQNGPLPYCSHMVMNCLSHDAWRIDWQRGAICLASSVTKLKTIRFFPVRLCEEFRLPGQKQLSSVVVTLVVQCVALHHKGHNPHLLHVLLPQRRS